MLGIPGMKLALFVGFLGLVTPAFASAAQPPHSGGPEPALTWRLERPVQIGGIATTVLGAPAPVASETGPALEFDGVDDGVIVPINPIAGFRAFTVEILVRPATGGTFAQRFFHIAEGDDHHLLVELRLDETNHWYVDTYLHHGDNRLPLIDKSLLHPVGVWTWVALRYADGRMAHFVNGKKECEGDVNFGPMTTGRTSIGVRLNRVFWFKGMIGEVRFHPAALEPGQMQRAD